MKIKLTQFGIFFCFLIIWQLVSYYEIINPVFIGSPAEIINEGINLFAGGMVYPYLLRSFAAFLPGFLLAIIFGVVLGLLAGINKNLGKTANSYILGFDSIPKIAFLPLIIIWFGFNFKAEIFIIFLMAIVPILINTIEGVKSTDKSLIKMAQSFGAKDKFILKSIVFFSSLPFIISGIKIAVGRSLVGLIISEFFGLSKGIGYLISFYGATFHINKMLAVISLIVMFSFFSLKVINKLEIKLLKWREYAI